MGEPREDSYFRVVFIKEVSQKTTFAGNEVAKYLDSEIAFRRFSLVFLKYLNLPLLPILY